MVAGVSGACYKKYRNLEEARAGWSNGPNSFNGRWVAPQPRPAMQTMRDSVRALHEPAQRHRPTVPHDLEADGDDDEQQLEAVADPDPVYVHVSSDFEQPDVEEEEGPEVLVPASPTTAPLFSSALSDATLSPRPIETPQLPWNSLQLMQTIPSSSMPAHSPYPHVATTTSKIQPSAAGYPQTDEAIETVEVSKPKEIFVVVRGDRPGVYFDR